MALVVTADGTVSDAGIHPHMKVRQETTQRAGKPLSPPEESV